MDDGHRRLLNRYRRELVQDIANVEPLLDFLVSSDVFTANDDDIQDIRAQETPLGQAGKLLDLLQTRGPDAYECFLHALRDARPHLARLLEQSEGSKRPAPPVELMDIMAPRGTQPKMEETVRKLQKALREYYRELARSTTLLDHQTLAEPVGLDEVFVTLSALKFDEVRSLFAKEKKLTARKIQDLASKAWSDRRSGEEITELSRLLRLENGRSARSCLLLGHAASGKTLTLYKLLCLWAEGSEEFLNEFEFVFYVSCRDEQAMEGKHAWDVLRLDQFAISGLDKTQEKQLATYLEENSEKVLILFDGVDEGGEKWSKSEGIQQILRRKALGQCSFVVTGRLCLKAYEVIPRCVQHFHLAGLNDYHLEELLKRRLGVEEGRGLCDELKKAEWTKLRALMKETPLLANMVAVLAKDGLSLPKTRTEVYTVMLLNLVSRSQAKAGSAAQTSTRLEDLPKEVRDSLHEVGKVALTGLKRGQFVFDAKKDVTALSFDAAQRLGLVKEFRTVSVLGDKHEVHFCHLTWQEYLAAYCVSLAEDVEKELSFCQEKIGTEEETLPFWRFVAGLLDVKKLKILMRVLCRQVQYSHRTWRWLVFEMSCLAEAAQQPISCQEEEGTKRSEIQEAAAVSLPKKVDFSNCALSESEVHSVSVALSCATHVADVDLASANLGLVHLQILTTTGALQHVQYLNCSFNNLHGDCLVELRRALMSKHGLMWLYLVWCRLDESDCDVLCQILSSHKSLQGICLYGNPLGTNGHKILWPGVRDSQLQKLYLGYTIPVQSTAGTPVSTPSHESILFGQHMQIMKMTDNNLRTEDAGPLLKAAQPLNAPRLSLLDLSRNRIDNRIVNVLATVFKRRAHEASMTESSQPSPVALTVRLHDNEVDREGLEWLGKEMPVGSDDRVECGMLVVSGGKISQRDLSVHFDEYIQQGGKGDLDLRRAGVDASGAQQVAELLYNDRIRVEALNLGCNSIGDEGASNLANTLCRNSTLRALSIDGNKVGAIGFAALCKALVENSCALQYLSIGYNPIFAEREENLAADARQQLARLLTSCRGLKGISLYNTGLSDEECCVMADALVPSSTSIRLVSLADNQISDIGVDALCRGLEKNTTVRFFSLSNNSLSRDGLLAVFRCVEARSKSSHPLEHVWIGDANVDVSHFGGTVIRSTFEYVSLSSVVDTYCTS